MRHDKSKAKNNACSESWHIAHVKIKQAFLRRRVVADQVHSFGPDHAPDVHVVTHIDGTANFIACGPNQLKTNHAISSPKSNI